MKREFFVKNLRVLQKEHNLTQVQLAKALSIKQSSTSCLLDGSSVPKFDTLMDIADYFGVSIDWLCGRKSEREV